MSRHTRLVKFVFVITAIVALAGCAQTLPVQSLSADEKAYEQTLLAEKGSEAKVALGQLYFTHNLIDSADAVLRPVVAAEPQNAQALAWYGANNCRKAGARGPWLMGMDKLYMVKQCLDQTERALAMAPNDFVVQMVQMNTGLEVDKFGSLDRAIKTKSAIERNIAAAPKAIPGDALAQFYVSAARIERELGNANAAQNNLERATRVASATDTKQSIDSERKLLLAKSKR
jgi:tetratricopeptide (TPR) repeat protein